jgi:Flp pilus assembly pilin Flp
MLRSLWKDEDGMTTVEYALLLVLIAIAAISAWSTLGTRVAATVTGTTSSLPAS